MEDHGVFFFSCRLKRVCELTVLSLINTVGMSALRKKKENYKRWLEQGFSIARYTMYIHRKDKDEKKKKNIKLTKWINSSQTDQSVSSTTIHSSCEGRRCWDILYP